MTTIIFNAIMQDGANEFLDQLHQLCASRGMMLDEKIIGDTCIITACKEPTGTFAIEVNPENQPNEAEPVVVVVPNNEIPAETESELPTPVLPEMSVECGEVVVLSLTTECAIPAYFNSSNEVSKLCVSNVSCIDDNICFEYCGSYFKYPKIAGTSKYSGDYINIFSDENCFQQSDKLIRIVIQFTNSDTVYPIIVDVCEKDIDSPYCVSLGKDLEFIYQEITE